jgi:RNA polymerase sigma-70 factor (ECF subfamily)
MVMHIDRGTPLAQVDSHTEVDGHDENHINARGCSSEQLLQRQETRVLVRRCIDRLPDTYRTVLLLRDIEELDTEETADLLGITSNAVKIRLHRARQALRTLLERELLGETAGAVVASNPA